jgi:UV DNA damage endonuclease
VIGEPLRSHDSRRWQNAPHLSVSLAYLRDVFEYLHRKQIRFYRLAGQLAPYLTHPGLPAFHRQLDECATELAVTGDLIREYGLRVTLHPAHYVQLNAPDAWLVRRAEEELGVAAALLDAMGLDRDAVIVVHVGGVYGDAAAGRARFVTRFLSAAGKRAAPAWRWSTTTGATPSRMRCGFIAHRHSRRAGHAASALSSTRRGGR